MQSTKSIVEGAILVKNSLANKLKQVPEGYLIVGIDPHQKKHAAVAMTQDFTTRCKFKFNNSREGYDMALERLREEMIRAGCKGIMFALETGGHYWRNLAYFLDERGLPFRFINQFTLKRRREGKDLNRRKNDYRDSEVAAQLLCTGEFTDSKLKHGVYAELHAANNSYRRMVKERTRIGNLIRGLLDGLFPEFSRVFKDACGLTALSVLATCPIPSSISSMTEEQFVSTIRSNHRGLLKKKKLRDLYQVAGTSVGIEVGARAVSLEIGFLVEKLRLIKRQLQSLEKVLIQLVDQTEEGKYLLSITGLNYISVAGLLAELGSFRSYRSAKQMIKMAGSNPTEKESGGKRGQRTPMSKHGRPALRHCAWTSVVPMLRFNADFRAWAKQRRERPAHANPLCGKEVLGAALNRLLRLAFALVRNRTYYQVSRPELALSAKS
jgi:transposase